MGLGHARHAQGMMRSTSVHVSGHSPITQASEFPYSTNIEIVETAATPVEGSPVRVAPPFERVRSRTPDPEGERYSLDEQALGVPLSRVSTAPCEDAVLGRGARSRNVARHVASANKLTRMGFVATDGYQTPSGYSTPGAGNKNKFGGLKSFVQSLKGRA
ncbi:hypothetical protein OE88DRAFT_1654226 [Heliocybe sulcata]|uniref:Uncharacterized protein n=1 Tax=Heliocybe sulcata TaxID=5364 RepID=A0A5C3N829_9AGAM|nr:hypothetical protein OE88DRAFT_1654226 [Heliocybe sulcata]